jgi:lipopolysaccharide/colanic/teichoic acid biosynthesis glycosyltransferase
MQMNIVENIFLSKKDLNLLDINTPEQFHMVLKCERFRCDRINKEFSLVVFNVKENKRFLLTTKDFVDLLKSKTRDYDEIGWFDENHIALLLPETSRETAQKVINKISLAMEQSNSIPDFSIFSYPSINKEYKAPVNNNHNIDINIAIADGYVIPLWKRAFDIVFSLSILTFVSPLLLLTAAFIKVVSPGPVFFRQQRVGQSGKIFNLLKLRTMKVNNDDSVHREYLKKLIKCDGSSELPMVKLMDDKRIIMFGKIIRKTCIDELPQFINVLLGDMSIVGPRPCIPYEAEEFLHWHKRRFDIIPGITGLWQVSGKNDTTFKEMIRLDIEYSVRRSFLMDLKIIIKTPGVIIGQVFDSINNRIERKSHELVINSVEIVNK